MIKPALKDMPHVEIVIDKEGNVTVEVHRVTGSMCESATREIEQKLGIVTGRSRKSGDDGKVRLTE